MSETGLSSGALLVLIHELVGARHGPILVPEIGRELESLEAAGRPLASGAPDELVRLLAVVRTLVAHGLVERSDNGYELTELGRQRVVEERGRMDPDLLDAIRAAAGALTHER